MPQNGILVEGITALAACIESNPNLRKININDNTVTEKGALAIGKALEHCKYLESLDSRPSRASQSWWVDLITKNNCARLFVLERPTRMQ